MSKTIEIRVRPVTRWIVTRFESEDHGGGVRSAGCEGLGEFASARAANRVAQAMGRVEPEAEVHPICEGPTEDPVSWMAEQSD